MISNKSIFSAGHIRRLLLLLSLWTVSGGSVAGAEKPFAIYVMKVDGSQVRKLAQVDDYTTHEAARWSHDGKQVVFAARSAISRASDIFVVNVDGSGLRKLGAGRHPDWSPDDKQIAFDLPGAQGTQVFVQNLDGQGSERVAQGSCPRWSPDGSQLAFAEGRMLYVMDLATAEQRALFDTPFETLYWGCCWSPDGKSLALSARPEPRARRHVLLVSADGASHGLRVRLQNEASGQMGFSPDGKQLAFDNAYLIHIVDVEGNAPPRQLPGQKAQNLSPDWSPDGQWLVFTSNRD
jgi:Tol biopolymer transport system component